MRYAIVPIQTLMEPYERILATCKVGVYVGRVWAGLVVTNLDSVRLIKCTEEYSTTLGPTQVTVFREVK